MLCNICHEKDQAALQTEHLSVAYGDVYAPLQGINPYSYSLQDRYQTNVKLHHYV